MSGVRPGRRRPAEDTVARYGGSHDRDLDRHLARPDVDAVIITTPHDTHEPLLAAALEAGKHVLLEKPLAQDLATARRMVSAAEAFALTTGVLFPTRTDPRFVRAREAIGAGAIGTPLGVSAHYLVDKSADRFQDLRPQAVVEAAYDSARLGRAIVPAVPSAGGAR
ncbi:Gfo/Idh/MocA family protein [Streptomyces sp. NPDC056943]|uniref:Gfo/Idh/MocA family protein n=1 Tax=Streptomyces sp. NPDC056943 TaxID=3345971 RepID=UPI003627237C